MLIDEHGTLMPVKPTELVGIQSANRHVECAARRRQGVRP